VASVVTEMYGVNKYSKHIANKSEINAELAKEIVQFWYNKGARYNYTREPINNDASKLIVRYRMFIIKFLELLINYNNNYRNNIVIN